MTLPELWKYKEAMISCAQFYKDQDRELSQIFKEEAKWALEIVWSRIRLRDTFEAMKRGDRRIDCKHCRAALFIAKEEEGETIVCGCCGESVEA
ncbi:MAG: hypothetical protein GX667_06980 [Xanthomonadaceae bacterium]|nr:hypothetical protein [Xanthomonadaceae bacterium]